MAQPNPDREPDEDRDADADSRDLERLQRQVDQRGQVRQPGYLTVTADELERIDEVVHQAARLHGVSTRCVTTSRASATSARATAIPPATMISVLNTPLEIAVRIGTPKPWSSMNDAT